VLKWAGGEGGGDERPLFELREEKKAAASLKQALLGVWSRRPTG
jgi:hypothetical protein